MVTRFKKFHAFITGLLFITASAALAEPVAKEVDAYQVKGAPQAATKTIYYDTHHHPVLYRADLYGNYDQMGQAYGYLFKKELEDTFNLTEKHLSELKYSHWATQLFLKYIWYRYPQRQQSLLLGAAKTAGLNKDKLTYLDQIVGVSFIDFFLEHSSDKGALTKLLAYFKGSKSFCSFLAVFGDKTPDGQVIAGRNFDWITELQPLLNRYPTLIVYHPSPYKGKVQHAVAGVGSAGMFASITALNDRGLFAELNDGSLSGGDELLLTRKSYFVKLDNLLFDSESYSALEKALKSSAPDYSYLINTTGPGADQVSSFEMAPHQKGHFFSFKVRERTPKSQDVLNPQEDLNSDILVATNVFRLSGWEQYLDANNPYLKKPVEKDAWDYSNARYRALLQQARQHKTITLKTMQDIFATPLNAPKGNQREISYIPNGATFDVCRGGFNVKSGETFPITTIYSVVVDSRSRTLSMRFQQGDPSKGECRWTPWVTVKPFEK